MPRKEVIEPMNTVGHEKTDAHIPTIGGYLAGLMALIVLSMAAMWGMFALLAKTEGNNNPPATPMEAQRVVPAAPLLQTQEWRDVRDMRTHEDDALHSYGWVNKEAGVAHVPIERAMDLIVERGLPKPGIEKKK